MRKHRTAFIMVVAGTLLLGLTTASCAMTLRDVVIKTVNSNPVVAARTQGWQAAEQGVNQARGGYFPSVDVYANYAAQKAKNSSTLFKYKTPATYGYGVQAKQTLFNGFVTHDEVVWNQQAALAQSLTARATADDIALLAVKAYLDVLRTKSIVGVAAHNYTTHLRIYRMIKARERGGLSRKADSSQAVGRLALAKSNWLAAKQHYIDAQAAFNQVVGIMPTKLQIPTSPALADLPLNETAALQWAVSYNPLLKAAEANIAKANAQYQVSKASFFPHVSAVASTSYNRNLNGIKGNYIDYQAGVEAKYNLFRGGSDNAKRHAAAYFVEQAQSARDDSYRRVVENMRLAWNALQIAQSQLGYFQQHRSAAESTVQSYYQQFQVHKRTLLDLLNSENELFKARMASINGRYDLLFAKYRILNGGGQLINYIYSK